MNASIYAMNHSPKTQEREGDPLERENDLNALHQELCDLLGDERAKDWYFTNCAFLVEYSERCAAYVAKIDRICEAMPAHDIAALVAFADDVEAPFVCRTENIPDPRTPAQVAADLDDAETAETRAADYPM